MSLSLSQFVPSLIVSASYTHILSAALCVYVPPLICRMSLSLWFMVCAKVATWSGAQALWPEWNTTRRLRLKMEWSKVLLMLAPWDRVLRCWVMIYELQNDYSNVRTHELLSALVKEPRSFWEIKHSSCNSSSVVPLILLMSGLAMYIAKDRCQLILGCLGLTHNK